MPGPTLLAAHLNPAQFRATYFPILQRATAGTNVDPNIALAQIAQETGYGRSIRGNNLFNITGPGTMRGDNNASGQRISQSFRDYGSPEESAQHYVKLISTSPRYSGLLSGTTEERLAALGRSGYAEDPGYGRHVGERLRELGGSDGTRMASDYVAPRTGGPGERSLNGILDERFQPIAPPRSGPSAERALASGALDERYQPEMAPQAAPVMLATPDLTNGGSFGGLGGLLASIFKSQQGPQAYQPQQNQQKPVNLANILGGASPNLVIGA